MPADTDLTRRTFLLASLAAALADGRSDPLESPWALWRVWRVDWAD